MRFEFPFNLIGKSTVAFLTGQSWRALKYWFTGLGLKQRYQRCSAGELNQRFGSVCGAGYRLRAQLLFTKTSFYDNSTILNPRNVISLSRGHTFSSPDPNLSGGYLVVNQRRRELNRIMQNGNYVLSVDNLFQL